MTAKPSAITPHSYAAFILKALTAAGGIITEAKLDELIRRHYARHHNATDLEPWGDARRPKWVQNVASAKSSLARAGEVLPVKMQADDGSRRRQLFRVALGPNAHAIIVAVDQMRRRQPKRKPSYRPLAQPAPRHVVPRI